MPLTDAQLQATNVGGNVLVVAGAGTGKTRTLVERCVRCLLTESPPLSLDQMLIVTFTEAAAAEVRQRIRARLQEQLDQNPQDLRWYEQVALFDTAHIGTLHSFCLQMIRPHFYELEIDPQVSVMPEEEARLLAEETLTRLLDEHYAGRTPFNEAVQELIQSHGLGSDRLVRSLILRLHHYTQTLPDPARWFEQEISKFSRPEPLQWNQWLLAAFEPWRAGWLPALDRLSHFEPARESAAALRAVPSPCSRRQLGLALNQIVDLCASPGQGTNNDWLKPFRRFASDAAFLRSLALEKNDRDPLVEDWDWARKPMLTLLELAREFSRTFSDNKRELGLLDFHDLEQYALRLLWDPRSGEPTPIASQWRQKLRFIFVDEYQDINGAQDQIIQALSRTGSEANRFLVGDVKQSIYRFRLANPRIFQEYAATWRGKPGQTIPLVENFRSREGLLDFINSVFEVIMVGELGGVRYDEEARLRLGATEANGALPVSEQAGPCVELHLRVKKSGPEAPENPESEEASTDLLALEEPDKEARIVALRLLELKTQKQIWDQTAQRFRPLEWRDIAILLRAPSGKAESYAKEFSRLEIPLVVPRAGFYESLEVSDLVSLLQILDNPLQDLPLLAVLHSPLAGLTANDLALVRQAAKGPFWTALNQWAKKSKIGNESKTATSHQEPMVRKIGAFLERFARWRRLARQVSISRCLDLVLTETHYASWVLTQSRGAQRRANVQRLLRLAQQFDHFQRQGLFRFLCFIQAQQRADAEPQVEPVSAENSARLMSIHQSKGLEFPVVVLPDLAKPFNQEDLRAEIILDELYGLCPRIKPPHTGSRYPSLPYWLAQRRQWKELLGEELRLLYVAMTRARDTLVLSASLTEKKLKKMIEPVPSPGPNELAAANCYLDWIALWFPTRCRRPVQSAEEVFRLDSTLISGENALVRWFVHEESRLLESPDQITQTQQEDPKSPQTSVTVEQIRERLNWQYPFLPATQTPAKASVTTLRRQAASHGEIEAESTPGQTWTDPRILPPGRRPKTSEPGLAADIGNAHHLFLQLVSLNQTDSLEALRQETSRLAQNGVMPEQELALLDLHALVHFWNSDLGRKIRGQAAQVRREVPFTARFSPEEIMSITAAAAPRFKEQEFIVVQGVADLLVVLPEALWLVDFKTDALQDPELDARAQIYYPQMKLYARALSAIYRRPVTECWLHFLNPRRSFAVPLAPVTSTAAVPGIVRH